MHFLFSVQKFLHEMCNFSRGAWAVHNFVEAAVLKNGELSAWESCSHRDYYARDDVLLGMMLADNLSILDPLSDP